MEKSLDIITTEFQRNPFDYLYESDLRCKLFAHLFKEYEGSPLKMRVCSNETLKCIEDDIFIINELHDNCMVQFVISNPVKAEYPKHEKNGQSLYDIAILDKTRLFTFDDYKRVKPEQKSDTFWFQPIETAFEIKYDQVGLRADKKKIQKDINKLQNGLRHTDYYKRIKRGILMIFVQFESFNHNHFIRECLQTENINTVTKLGFKSSFSEYGLFVRVVTPTSVENYCISFDGND